MAAISKYFIAVCDADDMRFFKAMKTSNGFVPVIITDSKDASMSEDIKGIVDLFELFKDELSSKYPKFDFSKAYIHKVTITIEECCFVSSVNR